MFRISASLAVAVIVAVSLGGCAERSRQHGMMSGGMMGEQGGCPMMGGAMAGPTDERLAQLRDELKITAVQQAKWSDFAEALRTAGKSMDSMAKDMHAAGATSLPDRIGRHVIAMESHLTASKRIQATAVHLYGVLSAEQKASADKALRGMGMM